MRIELTMKADYVPNWGVWAGIRELLQNAKDAETEYKAPMTIAYLAPSETLIIRNSGTSIPLEALLIGHTSKKNRPDLIGQFGEGLKLGVLALLRSGCDVVIKTGSQVWTPALEKSERFDATVMAFHIEDVPLSSPDVEIHIHNISPTVWADVCSRVKWLRSNPNDVETDVGTLLTDAREAGKVYVKGLYVTTHKHFSVGYDFANLSLDRDRMMSRDFDTEWESAKVWNRSISADPSLAQVAYTLIQQAESHDLFYINNIDSAGGTQKSIAAMFVAEHGNDVIPVSSEAEAARVQHFGIRGVVTTNTLARLFHEANGGLDEHLKNLAAKPIRVYEPTELSKEELDTLNSAIAALVVEDPQEPPIPPIWAADFRDPRTLGLFRTYDILISRTLLNDLTETLATLIHELAHRYGGDGQFEHVRAMETIAGAAIARLLQKQSGSTDQLDSPGEFQKKK